MTVFVNQQAIEVPIGASVSTLIQQLEMQDKPIAIAIGNQIIRRDTWDDTLLSAESTIHIISICKGG